MNSKPLSHFNSASRLRPSGLGRPSRLGGQVLLVMLALGGIIFALIGCGRSSSVHAAAPSPSARDNHVVATAPAQLETVADSLDLGARVQADPASMVRVYPPAGGRIVSLQVRPGDHVSRGQTLAVLESSDIAGARSDYTKALAEKEHADRSLKRASLLYEHQVLPEKEYLDAQTDAATAESELRRARERLRLLGVAPEGVSDELRVIAPRSGVVLDLGAAAGEFNKALDAQQPMCTVADLSHVWITGDVYEKDLAGLRKGSPVRVTVNAYPGRTWNGVVDAVSDQVDPTTRTLKLRVVLPNPGLELKPEMFAQIHVVRGQHRAILLPETAVLHEGEKASVFVEQTPGKFDQREVTLASTKGDKVEIASGLNPGDKVVVEGAALLRGEDTKND